MPSVETSDLAVIQELIEAGVLDESDVVEKNPNKDRDNYILGDTAGTLKGGSGDDLLVGVDGVANRFFIDGRDRGNDEGRHVDVIQNFKIGEDTLGFRLDGGYFKTDGGDGDFFDGPAGAKLDQSTNGNQANFSTASDLADLLLHVNTRGTVDDKATGVTKTYRGFETQEDVDAARARVDAGEIKKTVQDATRFSLEVEDNSFVKVVGEHIVINIDDFKHAEDHYDKWGNFRTTDKTIVLEDFEEQLASQFAVELGYDEFASRADSVHILGQDGDFSMGGGSGDNLFIMSAQQDTISIDDRNAGNDENGHINIIHGFDLTEDKISGRFDGGFFDGSNKATFEGAAGLVALLTFAENIDDTNGNLAFDLQSVGGGGNRDPLTFVLTDTSLTDVYDAAQAQVFNALAGSGAIDPATIPPAPGGNGDGIILNGDDNKGDDIFSGIGVDVFRFDSRDAAEDGTGGTSDGLNHVNVVLGFNSGDTLNFRIDGGYFSGLVEDLPDVDVNGTNRAVIGYDGVDELGAYINTLGGSNSAYYDAVTNSTVLTIDDSPANPNDNLTIVLWDSDNLLI